MIVSSHHSQLLVSLLTSQTSIELEISDPCSISESTVNSNTMFWVESHGIHTHSHKISFQVTVGAGSTLEELETELKVNQEGKISLISSPPTELVQEFEYLISYSIVSQGTGVPIRVFSIDKSFGKV